MKTFYKEIVENNNLDEIPDAILYYNKEIDNAREDLDIKGSVMKMAAQMPGIIEYRFAQLQELEAICQHIEIIKNQAFATAFKGYFESYDKSMSSRDAEKYANGDETVIDLAIILNSISVVRNKFLGITKALESKHYQLTNIIKMKASGVDDFSVIF